MSVRRGFHKPDPPGDSPAHALWQTIFRQFPKSSRVRRKQTECHSLAVIVSTAYIGRGAPEFRHPTARRQNFDGIRRYADHSHAGSRARNAAEIGTVSLERLSVQLKESETMSRHSPAESFVSGVRPGKNGANQSRAWTAGALIALVLSGAIGAQERVQAPGAFDYFVLSLSWAPEFCDQPGEAARNPQECAPGRNIGFIVHGLWPEAVEGRSPESCGPAKSVSRGIVNSMLGSMPSAGLIQHEWAVHGVCSGMTQSGYFTSVLLARAAVQIPVQVSSLRETVRETPRQIEGEFEGANPAFPRDAFRIACRNGALTEVRACFDKSLKARACAASAGECTATSLTIRQPR